MKDRNKKQIGPIQISLLGMFGVIYGAISERMGTYPNYQHGRFSHPELMGVIFPLAVLIIPIFVKALREEFWSKKSILLAVCVLVVGTIVVLIMSANRDIYWRDWYTEKWSYSESPKIIWDIWNTDWWRW